MLKNCTSCGKELPDGVDFCPECGSKVENTDGKTVLNSIPVIMENDSKIVSTGAYFGLMLLFAIPFIGFIACLIISFTSKNKNIKHYARAVLIWTIIVAIITIILSIIGYLLLDSLMDYINLTYGETMNGFSDILNEFEKLFEQNSNINMETIK